MRHDLRLNVAWIRDESPIRSIQTQVHVLLRRSCQIDAELGALLPWECIDPLLLQGDTPHLRTVGVDRFPAIVVFPCDRPGPSPLSTMLMRSRKTATQRRSKFSLLPLRSRCSFGELASAFFSMRWARQVILFGGPCFRTCTTPKSSSPPSFWCWRAVNASAASVCPVKKFWSVATISARS